MSDHDCMIDQDCTHMDGDLSEDEMESDYYE